MRLTGLGEEQRSDLSHLTLATLERLPCHRLQTRVRRQILREDVYLLFFLLLICIYILLYLLLHALHAGSFPLSKISIWAFGLTPSLDYSFVHSQVYHRDEIRYKEEVRVHR